MILVVEDEAATRSLIRGRLHDEGLTVVGATTLEEARQALRAQDFTVIILDLTLPDGTGLDLLRDLRSSGSKVHVIVLSGLGAERARVQALDLGADDYVVKPFSLRELAARVLAVRRRTDPARDATLHVGHLVIDLARREVTSNGRPIAIPAREFALLAFLAARPGVVFSRDELLRSVWGSAPDWQLAATVTEHVRRLRLKVEVDPHRPELIRTVRGSGYRFDVAPSDVASPPDDRGTVFHVEGRIVGIDDAALALVQRSREAVIGRHLRDFVAADSLAAAEARFRQSALGIQRRSQLMTLKRPDGPEIAVQVDSAESEWDGAPARRVVLTPTPNSSAVLRHLVTGIATELSDAVIIVDLHSHIRSWNKAAERLYGWSEHEVLGRHVLDVVRGDDLDDASATWRALETLGHSNGDVIHRTRDGSMFAVRTSTTLLRDDDHEPVGVVSVNRPSRDRPDVAALRTNERLESEIRRGIDLREFEVHYQPVVTLEDATIVTVEALARWNHPERGLLAPAEFLDVAEQSGLIRDLGALVLDDACRQTAVWRADGFDLKVSVNLSTHELGDDTLAERVAATLAAAGLDPSALWLEVTETGLVEDVGKAREVLEHLASLGIGIAIDDFGTGWASLTYLREFPVHALKVDRTFVTGIEDDAHSAVIVRSVLLLGQELGMFVVAEGVETAAEQAALQSLGVELGQGYRFGRPVPASEVPVHKARILTHSDPGAASSDLATRRHSRGARRPFRGKTHPAVQPSAPGHPVAPLGHEASTGAYHETASDAVASMLRGLLRIDSVGGAVDLLQRTIRALGGTVVLAEGAGTDALPIDVSLEEGPPVLVTVEPFSVARMQLERLLPGLVEDARQAVTLLRSTGAATTSAVDTALRVGGGAP